MAPLEAMSQRSSPPREAASHAAPGNILPLVLMNPQQQQGCQELVKQQLQELHGLQRRAEAWLQQVGDHIVCRNHGLRQLLDRVEAIKSRVGFECEQLRRSSRSTGGVVALRNRNYAAIIPGDSVAEMVVTSSVFNFLNIYNTLLITRLVLTWFPSAPEVLVNPLSTICDPYLNVFRGIIPPLGTLDLSPILAFLVLNVFTNTASALPAEMDCKPREKLTWRQLAQQRKGKKKAF